METFLATLAGIVFGGLISYWISRFYYKKSVKTKHLSCFVQFVSEILTDIAPDIKKKLLIQYAGQEVESLYQVQFIIANDGDFPIRDIIKPLTLKIPNKGVVLDANIIHIEPNGRNVILEIIQNDGEFEVEFNFPLLNSGEYFVAKLLVRGNAPRLKRNKEEIKAGLKSINFFELRPYNLFSFTITADDLPPEIKSERLPNYYSENAYDFVDKSSYWGGAIVGSLAFILGYLLFSLKWLKPDLFFLPIDNFFSSFSFLKFCIIICWLIVLVLVITAIAIPASEIGGTTSKKKTKFKIPRKLSGHRNIRLLD
jgi:hypothetical protein